MVNSIRLKWNAPMKICSSFFDDLSDWVEKRKNILYGYIHTFEFWGLQKVNEKLLESLIDEYNDRKRRSTVEVDEKVFACFDLWQMKKRIRGKGCRILQRKISYFQKNYHYI